MKKAVQNKSSIKTLIGENLRVWHQYLSKTSCPKFFPLFFDQNRYLVLMGGAGSGKSTFAARKLLERAILEGGHRFLVVRKVARTLKESCLSLILDELDRHYPDEKFRLNSAEMKITFEGGSEILFVGLSDSERIKSVNSITGIWIEEASELTESDFNQLDIRLRGETASYKQLIVTFNPVSVKHWLKRKFFDSENKKATVVRSNYKDNPFLDDDYKEVLESYKLRDKYYYNVYCLGNWGVTGNTVFDELSVMERLERLCAPVRVGSFDCRMKDGFIEDFSFDEYEGGFIKVYEEPRPGIPYVIGADTAGDGSDSFVGQVLDNVTGRQVATLRHTFDEDIFARQIYCLGKYYNNALVAIETNFSTYPVRELSRLGYKSQFVREKIDAYTGDVTKSYGFLTNTRTRPVILSELIAYARENIDLINDDDTLYEMLTFVRDENLRIGADKGAHDDCVMALAIALFARRQQSSRPTLIEKVARDWTHDMWEDYQNASEKDKLYLLEKWGRI